MTCEVVFLSQGPKYEASSSPFRLLRGYARLDPLISARCTFRHHSLVAFEKDSRRCFKIAEEIVATKPEILAVSLYCWNTSTLLMIAGFCKQLHPALFIVAGGPDTYGEAPALLRAHPSIDVVIDGEGEVAFQRLLHEYVRHYTAASEVVRLPVLGGDPAIAVAKGIDFSEVPFATFRHDDAIVRSPNRTYVEDLDQIPSAIIGIDAAELETRFYLNQEPAVIVETSRGCPVNCAFCQYPKNDDGRMRYYGIDRVLAELDHIRRVGIKHVYFADGILTVRKERAAKIFEYFLETFVDGRLHTEIKLDMFPAMNVEQCKELFRQRRLHFGVGVQSVNAKTLKGMGRPTNLERMRHTAEAIEASGSLRWDLIYGLPGDKFEDVLAGVDYIHTADPGANIVIQPLQVLPGTSFRENASRHGLVYDPENPYTVLRSGTFGPEDMAKARALGYVLDGFQRLVSFFYRDEGLSESAPDLFKELFTADYFDYVSQWGWEDVAAHAYFFASRLRAYVLPRLRDPSRGQLVSEALDCAFIFGARGLDPNIWGERLDFSTIVSRPQTDLEIDGISDTFRVRNLFDDAFVFQFSHDLSDRLTWPPPRAKSFCVVLGEQSAHMSEREFALLRSVADRATAKQALDRLREDFAGWRDADATEIREALHGFLRSGLVAVDEARL